MLKSGIYDFVICRGGTDMCFVLGFGRKRPDLKQYRISGLTIYVSIWVDILNQDGVFVPIHTHVAIHTLLILMFIIIVKFLLYTV